MRNQSLHSLVIAPKTFGEIFSKNIGQSDDRDKSGNGGQKPGFLGPVSGIFKNKYEPESQKYFRNDSESEILAGNKRKEERRRNNKRDKRHKKDAYQYDFS